MPRQSQRIAPRMVLGFGLAGALLGSIGGLVVHWQGVLNSTGEVAPWGELGIIVFVSLLNGALLGIVAGLIPGLGTLGGLALHRRWNASVNETPRRLSGLAGAAVSAMLVACGVLAVVLPSAHAEFWLWTMSTYLVVSMLTAWILISMSLARDS
ncbi:hypothetical protein [Glutamicibacter sp. NPDC087344]|uniref:hypothetical protein n=1 Tax=Glutamicibacter sp. NPDC087344 TaxID=3363994 RepID=UPI003817D339